MDKIFADGLQFKLPREGAPDFVKGSISVKVSDFVPFLEKHQNNAGWVNIDVKESKGSKIYCELNTYKPEKPEIAKSETEEDPYHAIPDGDQVPF